MVAHCLGGGSYFKDDLYRTAAIDSLGTHGDMILSI